jgi:hypothetical protein
MCVCVVLKRRVCFVLQFSIDIRKPSVRSMPCFQILLNDKLLLILVRRFRHVAESISSFMCPQMFAKKRLFSTETLYA